MDITTRLLRLAACTQLTGEYEAFRQLADAVTDWPSVFRQAEAHGLAPLVHAHVVHAGVRMDAQGHRTAALLCARHQAAARIRSGILIDVVDALDAANINHVVLKGAVLAHLIYPRPELRPMRDLDLLVGPADAARTLEVLRRLGCAVADQSSAARPHHHLPPAVCERDGLRVPIEVHLDAISYSQDARVRLDRLRQPPQDVVIAGARLRALGHEDMLVHLVAHAFEPAFDLRLGSVADVVGYATHFAAEIDWLRLRASEPRVVNALTLLHFLSPLPGALAMLRPPPHVAAPAGIGELCLPLSAIRNGGISALLSPPAWWLHAFYGVSPASSLGVVRLARHPWRVGRWASRWAASAL